MDRKGIIAPQQISVKAIMTETGFIWNGLKVFIFVPLTGGNNPQEIARLFTIQIMQIVKRAQQLTLGDIYKYEQIIRQKIEAGESLLGNQDLPMNG